MKLKCINNESIKVYCPISRDFRSYSFEDPEKYHPDWRLILDKEYESDGEPFLDRNGVEVINIKSDKREGNWPTPILYSRFKKVK